jgi:proteasome assembly chaperone (PAC2) family protein
MENKNLNRIIVQFKKNIPWMIMMKETLCLRENIALNNSIMIIGLHGWGNAGQVSTYSLQYLINSFHAVNFGKIIPDQYHNYQIERPLVSINQGIIESYHPPKNELFYWKHPENKADLLFLRGSEPHLNWANFASLILDLAIDQNVQRIFTIGGYLTDIASSNSLPISASMNNPKFIDELTQAEIILTNYSGPTSIYSELSWRAKSQNIDVISIWCGVPFYIKELFPPAVYQLLKKIQRISDISIDFPALQQEVDTYLETEKESPIRRQYGTIVSTGDPPKDMYIA